jgi:hypothetical protein
METSIYRPMKKKGGRDIWQRYFREGKNVEGKKERKRLKKRKEEYQETGKKYMQKT